MSKGAQSGKNKNQAGGETEGVGAQGLGRLELWGKHEEVVKEKVKEPRERPTTKQSEWRVEAEGRVVRQPAQDGSPTRHETDSSNRNHTAQSASSHLCLFYFFFPACLSASSSLILSPWWSSPSLPASDPELRPVSFSSGVTRGRESIKHRGTTGVFIPLV